MTTPAWSWTWDETLFAGSARHYAAGRRPYPPAVAEAIAAELGLDGTGRLLDVGCGPGSLTTSLAPHFAAAVGVDADPEMIELARSRAPEIDWRCLRAEELPAGLGTFRVLTFAQSFHWMDQPVVARLAMPMIEPGGAWVHVGGRTHAGDDSTDPLPLPRPPWNLIGDLVRAYLGPVQRAGQGVLPHGPRSGEDDVMRATGWAGPVRIAVPQGVVERDAAEIEDAVLSLSSSAPHLFGPRLPAFRAGLRTLLDGRRFAERLGPVEVTIWRPQHVATACHRPG